LQCVAVCCSVLQCVAVCCSVLQCVAVCCSVLQCVAMRRYAAVRHSKNLPTVTIALCVAVCCSVLQCVAVSRCYNKSEYPSPRLQQVLFPRGWWLWIFDGAQKIHKRCLSASESSGKTKRGLILVLGG